MWQHPVFTQQQYCMWARVPSPHVIHVRMRKDLFVCVCVVCVHVCACVWCQDGVGV